MKTIRSMAGENKEIERFNKDLVKIDTLGLYKGMAHGTGLAIASCVTWGTVALGFWVSFGIFEFKF